MPAPAGRSTRPPRRCRSRGARSDPAAVRPRSGSTRRGDAEGLGLAGDHPFGHHQLGQPAAQLPTLTGAGSRQRGHLGRAAQDGLAGVDLAHLDRRPGDGGRHAHRTVTVTAGLYSSRPAQPIRTSAHHCPGATHGGGAMSKPTSTVEPARSTAPQRGRPGPLPGAPRADQVCLEGQFGVGVAADGDGQPGGLPWATTMSAGSVTNRTSSPGASAPTVTTQTSSTVCRHASGTSLPSLSWARTG